MPVYYVPILGPKRNLDHRSFYSRGRNVNEFIQIISFFERRSFKIMRDTVIGIVLCYSHQACYLLYYLAEINGGILIYQFSCVLLLSHSHWLRKRCDLEHR